MKENIMEKTNILLTGHHFGTAVTFDLTERLLMHRPAI